MRASLELEGTAAGGAATTVSQSQICRETPSLGPRALGPAASGLPLLWRAIPPWWEAEGRYLLVYDLIP